MIPATTPHWIQYIIPEVLWRINTSEKELYLTFDDGPIPEITPWVLDLLFKYKAKATFFCIGDNVDKHPDIYRRILDAGHRVGNHTQNHNKGWKTKNKPYFRSIEECASRVESNLFRPPYGKITQSQLKAVKKKYEVVLWSVLSKDYDQSLRPEAILANSLSCEAGDIIVFHDSLKAEENLRYVLPKFLKYYDNLGYSFKAIP